MKLEEKSIMTTLKFHILLLVIRLIRRQKAKSSNFGVRQSWVQILALLFLCYLG